MREDNTGLKAGWRRASLVLLWLLFFSTSAAQISINGFCEIRSFPAFPHYNHILISDLNFDNSDDLILYSSSKKSLVLIEGDGEGDFIDYRIVNTPFPLSSVEKYFDYTSGSEQYTFTSRKFRTAGVFNFSSFGRFNLFAKHVFDSFPENIEIADIKNNGQKEFLISGSGFNGISVLAFNDFSLSSKKVSENSIYSEALFCDLSNDDYPDICAHNIFDNTIDFFYNDRLGSFTKARSIPVPSNFAEIKSYDVNKDSFADLVCTKGNSIKIIYGDFNSRYDSSLTIPTALNADKLIVSDLNYDKINDIAYIDTTENILSICFGKSLNSFYPEIMYAKRKGLIDLSTFETGNEKGLVLLSKEGKIYTITKMRTPVDEVNIIPAIEPSAIAKFNYGNDISNDYCYVDEFTSTLNFLVSVKNNEPGKFYSVHISANHKKIIVDDTHKFIKGFYCYSPGKKLIEVIKYDFIKDKAKSHQIYTSGKIEFIKLNHKKDVVEIYVLYKQNDELKFGEYEYHDFRYIKRSYPAIDKNVLSARMYGNDNKVIKYWKENTDYLEFVSAKADNDSIERNIEKRIEKPEHLQNIKMFDNQNDEMTISLINSDMNYFTVVSNESKFNISNKITNNFKLNGKIDFYFDRGIQNPNPFAVFYSGEGKSFYKISLQNFGKQITENKLFDAADVSDFIISNINGNEKIIIYTSRKEGYISLKQLQ